MSEDQCIYGLDHWRVFHIEAGMYGTSEVSGKPILPVRPEVMPKAMALVDEQFPA